MNITSLRGGDRAAEREGAVVTAVKAPPNLCVLSPTRTPCVPTPEIVANFRSGRPRNASHRRRRVPVGGRSAAAAAAAAPRQVRDGHRRTD